MEPVFGLPPTDKQQTTMDRPEAIAAAALTARIQASTIAQIEAEHPWMPKAALKKMVETMSTVLRDSIAEQTPIMAAAKARVGFLKLSAELRNTIYGMALDDHSDDGPGRVIIQDIQEEDEDVMYFRPPVPGKLAQFPALLQTSKQIRKETQKLYFARTTFIVRMTEAAIRPAKAWLSHLPLDQRPHIQSIVLECRVRELEEVHDTAFTKARSPRSSNISTPVRRGVQTVTDYVVQGLGLNVEGVDMGAFVVKYSPDRRKEYCEETSLTLSKTEVLCVYCSNIGEPKSGAPKKLTCAKCGASSLAQPRGK